ncbi:MAG TPA: hypothetical protein VFN87_00870 [Solirubrobacteraceae bacterium]|nr:hypothetical protein [Solirubrobacteraceae bacterium]
MLLRNRPPGIDSASVHRREGFEHLEHKSLVVLRWLNANKIDYVLVGPVAHAVRGDTAAKGPVAIVPAPYGRNYDRLARALISEHAGLRSERGLPGSDAVEPIGVKLTGEKLARGRRWKLAFGDHQLDVEAAAGAEGPESSAGSAAGSAAPAGAGAPPAARNIGASGARYQELLYEANRFTLCDGLSVEVASLEDLEHYSHMRRTGTAPEFRVTRTAPGEAGSAAEAGDAETVSEPADVSPEQ